MLPASDQETRQTTDGNLPDAAQRDQFVVKGDRETDLRLELVYLLLVLRSLCWESASS